MDFHKTELIVSALVVAAMLAACGMKEDPALAHPLPQQVQAFSLPTQTLRVFPVQIDGARCVVAASDRGVGIDCDRDKKD